MTQYKNPRLYPLIVVPLLTVDTKDILSEAYKPAYEIIYKWIIQVGIARLDEYRGGFLHIGSEERNKHLLLDFIEKIGRIVQGNEHTYYYSECSYFKLITLCFGASQIASDRVLHR